MERITELHNSLASHSHLMNAQSTKLSNCISMHFAGNPLSLSQLGKFLDEASKVVRTKSAFNFGALGGNLIVSVKLNSNSGTGTHTSSTGNVNGHVVKTSSKRGYDDSYDRARDAVDAARKRLQKGKTDTVPNEHLQFAQTVICNMFRELKGTHGELVFESLGLSVTPSTVMKPNTFQSGDYSNPTETAHFSTRPRLIIACRLSGGVAIPAFTLKRVLSYNNTFFDGMITTKVDSLGTEYRMPLSNLGQEAESKGQQSMLLFVAVPNVDISTLSSAPSSTPSQKRLTNDDDESSDRPAKAARRM